MKLITKSGREFTVDDDDYEQVSALRWHVRGNYIATKPASEPQLYLHHFIIGKPPSGLVTDHENGDGYDNRRSNLRHVTSSTNNSNVPPRGGTSRYVGVYRHSNGRGWVAQIKKDKKHYYIGYFATELTAAVAYNTKALELFGSFAKINETQE